TPNTKAPPPDPHPERATPRRHPGDQRPPAVRAEEAELAGALGDLTRRVVLRPERQPTAREQQVEAGEEGEPHGQGQRRGPGRVLREVPVDDVHDGEERGRADEQPPFDLHELPPSCPGTLGTRPPRMPGLTGGPKRIAGPART